MEVQPKAVGWSNWNNGPTRFAEYNSATKSGAAVDLTQRATSINDKPNNPVLTADEAAIIGDMANTFGDWQPTLATEQAPVPTNVQVKEKTLTWDDSDYALLWAVCKDGRVIAFTSTPSYTVSENGVYAVRAANEMGGLSQPSSTVTVGTTNITNTRFNQSNGVTEYYSLSGVRVAQPQKGIYVVRGKKIVVK